MRKISTPFIVAFGLLMAIAFAYNFVALRKYRRMILYFRQHHPEIYEQIRVKPDLGPFYSSGNNYKASLDYAKNHEPLDDPIAEKLLTDYSQFMQKGQSFTVVMVVVFIGIFLGTVLLGQ